MATTPWSELSLLPLSGLMLMLQAVPSQCSMRVFRGPATGLYAPTVPTSLVVRAAMPFSSLSVPAAGVGASAQVHGGVVVGVLVGVFVGVLVGVCVGVSVGVWVGVALGVLVGVSVGVWVAGLWVGRPGTTRVSVGV